MKSRFTGILTLFLAFMIQFSFAQEKTITGTVTSVDDGLPLPGASVMVEGTTKGTQTDLDGKYSINATQGEKLVFSFVGMTDQVITVGASNTIDVGLTSDTVIEEVLVVGYGTTTKEGFTGSATKINSENLQAKTVSNISQALRGEVAGVSVSSQNGRPGVGATVRVRGIGSVNGNRDPLYVVDGAPYSSNISAINPEDIEDIVVLKDAAATSIYGSRGANGVILITTKQGKAGTSVISVDVKTSINSLSLPTYDVIESPEEYIALSWSQLKLNATLNGHSNPAAYASENLYQDIITVGIHSNHNIWNVPGNQLIDPATGQVAEGVSRRYTPNTFRDAAFATGYRSEATLQMRGGNDKTKYATSFGYLEDQGYAVNSSFKRYTTRLNLEHKPKSWLTVGSNIGYTGGRSMLNSDSGNYGSTGNVFSFISAAPPIYDVYLRDSEGNLIPDPYFGGYQYDYGENGTRGWMTMGNAVGDAHFNLDKDDTTTLLGNFNVKIDFTDWLALETRYSGQHYVVESTRVANPWYGQVSSSQGSLVKQNNKTTNQNFLQLLRFNKTFADIHNVEAFVAHESTEWRRNLSYVYATGAVVPVGQDISQYTDYADMLSYQLGWTLESYFGQFNYDYDKKYYLTASARRDGSSRFINDKWGTFWSAGLGWIVSKESFMDNIGAIDYLKLKASYGVIGDQGTALQYGWQLYNLNPLLGDINYAPQNTWANPNLTWETSKIAQVGIETTLFDRFDINVDYYVKNTTNLFFTEALPPSFGYTVMQLNDGKLTNSGLEFDVNARIIKAKNHGDFGLGLAFNGEVLTNKLTEMPKSYFSGEKKPIQTAGLYAWSEGRSIFDFHMAEWAGVDPGTGVGLYNLYYDDVNGDGVFNTASGDIPVTTLEQYLYDNPNANIGKTVTSTYATATRKYVGKSMLPKLRGAFRLNAEYKNFDFTAQVGYSLGGYAYDRSYQELMNTGEDIGKNNYHIDIRDRWQQPGDITNVPRLTANYGQDTDFGRQTTSTRFIIKSDYLALNNVKLGYTFPQEFMKNTHISRLNLYISGDNLAVWSARKGFNPQTLLDVATTSAAAGSNGDSYMPMTTITFGAKIEF